MERRSIAVQGVVQGVGFRPFVYGLASRLKLYGSVKNRTGDVLIEVEGEAEFLDRFLLELTSELPPLAQIDHLSWDRQSPRGERDFRIERSETDTRSPIFVSADVATCDDCMAELFSPHDRRYRYPFLNCTNCGPRLTIVTGAPYDRQRTTMASFSMCDRLPSRVRRSGQSPVSCRADGLSGLWATASATGRRRQAGRNQRSACFFCRGSSCRIDRCNQRCGRFSSRL